MNVTSFGMTLPTPGYRESEPAFDLPPIGTEAEFSAQLAELVASERPRLFALCEEDGDRADGWVLAWGMAFDDRTEMVGDEGSMRMSVASPEVALRLLSRGRRLRLVWCDVESESSGVRC